LVFRLNLAAIQITQAAMAPSQILLIIPFVRLGEWMLRVPRQPVSIKEALALMALGVGRAIQALGDSLLHAGLAWVAVAPIALLLVYGILTPIFEHAAARMRPAELSSRGSQSIEG
jgi:hypothetical protein